MLKPTQLSDSFQIILTTDNPFWVNIAAETAGTGAVFIVVVALAMMLLNDNLLNK